MDVFKQLDARCFIRTVEMHTCGEATRIVISGYPELQGDKLLEKRADASRNYDHIRARLMHEPRGHGDMYGAILVQDTELVRQGEADIGVLFCHNEGYSTICGHATIALGRFLVDTQDHKVFPNRDKIKYNAEKQETEIKLHAPCGLIQVRVPISQGKSYVQRTISFTGVPSFVSGENLIVEIPPERRWGGCSGKVRVDIAYGGAFYVIVSSAELGFEKRLLGRNLPELSRATATLKDIVKDRKDLVRHPEEDLSYLYGVIVVEEDRDGESGICFFADQQVDRSPTGSGVCARVALAVQRGQRAIGEEWTYRSVLTDSMFVGKAVDVSSAGVVVQVSGMAFYTGASSFVAEEGDSLRNGFRLGMT